MQVYALSIPDPNITCEIDDTECDPPIAENCGVVFVPDEECDFENTPEPEECAFNLKFCPDIDPVDSRDVQQMEIILLQIVILWDVHQM